MTVLTIVIGLVLLLGGGEGLVRGAVGIARRLGLSPLVIGLTLVGFGTSTPELVTSLRAGIDGYPDIAVGNVIGSNIANILLILGLAVVVSPMICDPRAFRRDGSVMVGAAVVLAIFALTGEIGRVAGLVLLVSLFVYIGFVLHQERKSARMPSPSGALIAAEAGAVEAAPQGLGLSLVLLLAGFGAIFAGAGLLVSGAVDLATAFGVPESVIAVTVVAVGTSMPELAASAVAAFRRQTHIAFGNIVGSNIFNILGILGITGLVVPLSIAPTFLALDIWVMLGVSVLFAAFVITHWRMDRWEGFVLLAGYGVYLGFTLA